MWRLIYKVFHSIRHYLTEIQYKVYLPDHTNPFIIRLTTCLCTSLRADQLVYIGLRDIDPYEAYILNKLGIRAYAMDSVDKYGIAKIMEMTMDALDVKNKIHVSFDVDALDCKVAPSTGTAVFGGLSLREGIFIMEVLSETKRIQGIDLVELNPSLGTAHDVQTTVSVTMEILKTICGGYRRKGTFENIDETLLNIKT